MTIEQDPREVSVVFRGVLVQGFAADTFVRITPSADVWRMFAGAGGEAVFAESTDRSAIVTVVMMPGSIGNFVFQEARSADDFDGSGTGPLTISDALTGTEHSAIDARVLADPEKVYSAAGVEALTWRIGCLDLRARNGVSPFARTRFDDR